MSAGQVALVTGASRGIGRIVECGPGKVLAGMVKRIDAEAQVLTLSDPASLAECKEALA